MGASGAADIFEDSLSNVGDDDDDQGEDSWHIVLSVGCVCALAVHEDARWCFGDLCWL